MAPNKDQVTEGYKKEPKEMVLPLTLATKTDVSRAIRELGKIEEFFHQAAIRGSNAKAVPSVSAKLSGLAAMNNLNLIHANDRARMSAFLIMLKVKAPVVHMSFPSEASADFTSRLLTWFRTNAHPYTVLHIGLQPELAAGCTLRTTNKVFDFSLRKEFDKNKEKLIAALGDPK